MHKFAYDEHFLSNFAVEISDSVNYGIISMVERPVYGD